MKRVGWAIIACAGATLSRCAKPVEKSAAPQAESSAAARPTPVAAPAVASPADLQALELRAIRRAFADGDAGKLARAADSDAASALARAYVAYLRALTAREPDWEAFLRSFPRDGASLTWLARDLDQGLSDADLPEVCGVTGSVCAPVSMNDRLVALAAEGHPLAIRTFVESWLTHSDGAVAEWVCLDPLPRILQSAFGPLLEQASQQVRAAENLKTCIQFQRPNYARYVASFEQLPLTGARALELKDDVLELIRRSDPDWP